jgi:hypothetical protein
MPPNTALHRIAARWRFGTSAKGLGWAARGELERYAALAPCRRHGIQSFGRMAVFFQNDKSATASTVPFNEGGGPWQRLSVF